MRQSGIAAIAFAFALIAGAAASAYEPMAPFAKLAGRAWRGEGTGPNGQPIVDIAAYEMILGGRAFQSTHRLEGGAYGGRSIIFFDEGAGAYVFHYFTTAGFHTTGTIDLTETGFTSVETVNGHETYAAVRAEAVIDGDRLHVVSYHITHDGTRSAPNEMTYHEIPSAEGMLFDGPEEAGR